MNMQSTTLPLGQAQADTFARLFNLVFSSALGYGPLHPTTQKNYAECVDWIAQLLMTRERVTMVRDRDSLYIEECKVDSRLNVRRFCALFARIDLHSISFERGCGSADLRCLVEMFVDQGRFDSVLSLQEEFERRGCTGIRLNYITFAKITADDTIVNRTQAPHNTAEDHGPVLDKLGSLISLKSLLENPRFLAAGILEAASANTADSRALVVEYLRRLNSRIDEQTSQQRTISAPELMESVYKLKSALREGLAVQQQLGRMLREEGSILGEVDQLTYSTIVGLVRSEYRSGTVAVRRLAHIISRLVPDLKDLKRLMPLLKEGLIADGMSLGDFLSLVKELNWELQNEGFSQLLEQASDSAGVSVEELFEAIRDNPQESARLLILAAEVRNGTGREQSQLEQLLADYIEGVSTRLTLASPDTAGPAGGKGLKTMIFRLEKQLLHKLQEQGIDQATVARVEQQLAGRFQRTLTQIKNDWMVAAMARDGEATAGSFMQILDSIADQELDLGSLRDSLREALTQRGYTAARIQEFYDRAAQRIRSRSASAPLPRGVLTSHNTLFFLQRQIKEHFRYGNPFSVLVVGLRAANTGSQSPGNTAIDRDSSMRQLFELCLKQLRDLDIVGSIDTVAAHTPFLILPMTPLAGALVVTQRIRQTLAAAPLDIAGTPTLVIPALVPLEFDRTTTSGVKPFLDQIGVLYRQAVAAAK